MRFRPVSHRGYRCNYTAQLRQQGGNAISLSRYCKPAAPQQSISLGALLHLGAFGSTAIMQRACLGSRAVVLRTGSGMSIKLPEIQKGPHEKKGSLQLLSWVLFSWDG